MREKEMLGQTDHPFVVQLICTYADPTHVYFLMTPALGGAQLADLALALALVLTLILTLALTLALALILTLILTLALILTLYPTLTRRDSQRAGRDGG